MAQKPFKLSQDQRAKLTQTERELHDLLPELDKAQECGIDCAIYREARDELFNQIQAIKKNYT